MPLTWPASLPQELLLTSTEANLEGNVAVFQPMLGPPLLYQRGDFQARAISGRIRIDDTQRSTFETFYETTLLMGTKRFRWYRPGLSSEVTEFQFQHPNAYQLTTAVNGYWLQLNLKLVRRIS